MHLQLTLGGGHTADGETFRHRLGMGLPGGGIAALVLSSVDIARALLKRVPELPVLAARNGVLDHQLGFLVQELHGTNTLETRRELGDNIDIPFRDPVTGEPGHVKAKIRHGPVGMLPFHCHIIEHENGG